jgi:hypothetical protein
MLTREAIEDARDELRTAGFICGKPLCDMALAYLDLRAKVDGAQRYDKVTGSGEVDRSTIAEYIRYADVAGDA